MSSAPDGSALPSALAETPGGSPSTLREWAMSRPARHRMIGARRATACRRIPKRDAGEWVERNGRDLAAQLGVSFRTWQRLRRLLRGAPEPDWPYLLMPGWTGRTSRSGIPRAAWDFFCGLYLVRRQPTVADCYRRTCEAASQHGWGELPCLRTFRRRVKTEITAREKTLRRHGAQALARLFPSQRRDKRAFRAGEAVSGDGLKFDRLWVELPGGELCNTVTGWFWQDLVTGFVAAHRLAQTETLDLFRLATRSLVEVFVPDHAWVDNTMVAASKTMTGQQAGKRYRGRKRAEDPPGLLAQLGIEVHHTSPDKIFGNPGAKPIERSFGVGGIHDMVASHPRFLERGVSRKTAVPFGEFAAVVAEEVEKFNDRPNRRTAACRGVLSFRQAWLNGISTGVLRVATDEQVFLLSRMPEVVTADRQIGEIRLKAGRGPLGRRRYWSEFLTEFRGRKVCVWYDPEDFSAAISITTLDGRHLGIAECVEDVGFADRAAAQEWGRNKRRFVRAEVAAAKARERMTAAELAEIYPAPEEAPDPPDPGVVRGTFRRTAELAPREAAEATGTDGAPSAFERRLAAAALAVAPAEEWED